MIVSRQNRLVIAVLVVSMLLATAANAQTDRAGAAVSGMRAAPTNAAGQPVRNEGGIPLNYGPNELQIARPAPLSATAAPVATVLPAGTLARWGFAAFGSGIGLSGIVTAKNGASTEVYVGGSAFTFGRNNYWYALRYSSATGKPEQVYVSEYFPQTIRRIALARWSGSASPLIVVALADGTVRLYDQASKQQLLSYTDPCATRGGLQAFTTADLDGNGIDEFISICGNQMLIVYGFTGFTPWSLAGVGGTDIAVGQMDDDPALEIATTSGKVIDSATHTVQWQWPQGFGAHLQAADIDGDGRDELIVAEGWYIVWAYDVEKQLPKWSIPTRQDIGAILVTDLDGDGVKELLIGDGQWGAIHAYDTMTQQEKWSIVNPENGVTNIAVADVNNDGTTELLWGAGASSTGPDYLYVANWQTRMILWQNEHLDGPFVGPQIGDLDGDGIPEIVIASFSSNSGYKSGRIVVIDSRTGTVRAISPGVAGGFFTGTINDLKLRDLNGDGRLEILVATRSGVSATGLIEAYSFSTPDTFTLVWTNATGLLGAFHSVDVADIDGDGDLEVIAGGYSYESTNSYGVSIHVYDLATRVEKWHTLVLNTSSYIADLVIANTDGDGAIEVAGMVASGDVYVFDGATHAFEAIIDTQGASLTAFNSPSGTLLLIGDATGRVSVRAFDGVGYPEVAGQSLGSAALDGLNFANSGAWWVGSGGTLRRFFGNTTTFESANYGTGFGRNLGTLPGRQIVFSAGGYGIHGFVTAP